SPASNRSEPPRSETSRAPRTRFRTGRSETRHSAKAPVERRPAHWTGWPIVACSSRTSVDRPSDAARSAAAVPAGPAPPPTPSYRSILLLLAVLLHNGAGRTRTVLAGLLRVLEQDRREGRGDVPEDRERAEPDHE